MTSDCQVRTTRPARRKMSRSWCPATVAAALFLVSCFGTATACSVTQNGTHINTLLVHTDNTSPAGTVVVALQSTDVSSATLPDNTYITLDFSIATGEIKLLTTKAFEEYEVTNIVSTISLVINYACTGTTGQNTLQVNVQLRLNNKYAPVFISGGTTGPTTALQLVAPSPLPRGYSVAGGCERSLRAIDYGLDDSSITFAVQPTGSFAVAATSVQIGGKPGYELAVTTAALLQFEQPLVVTLTATDGGTPPRSTNLTITLTPDATESTPPSPWFSEAVYSAEITEAMSSGDTLPFTTDISITEGYDSSMKVALESIDGTDWSSEFSVHHSDKVVQIRLAANPTEELLKKPFLALVLKANRDQALKEGRAVVLLTLPGSKPATTTTSITECPSTVSGTATCEPCPPTVSMCTPCDMDCSKCTTSTTKWTTLSTSSSQPSVSTESSIGSSTVIQTPQLVKFNESLYEFSGQWPCSGTSITLGKVVATVIGGEGKPTYSIEGAPDSVKIDRASGSLSLERPLVPRNYIFKAVAEWKDSKDTATVIVAVPNYDNCTSNTNSTRLRYVFVITDFDEGSAYKITGSQPLGGANCSWTKVSEEPPNKNFFSVASNGTISTDGIDREDEVFSGRDLAEVLLQVNVTCDGDQEDEDEVPQDASDSSKAWYPLKSLRSSYKEITYLAVVNDINDNSPQFTGATSLVVGYPDEKLAKQLMPQSLVTVHATDKDVGLNAYIRYEIVSDGSEGSGQFVIHPHTGTIYPSESGFKFKDTSFKVVAKDQDGAPGCLQSDYLTVQVRILGSQHLTVLTVEGRLVEDTDSLLQQIHTSSGLVMKVLSSAVVPSSTASTRSWLSLHLLADSAPKSLLRLVAYALNTTSDLPVPFSGVKQALDGSNLGFKLAVSELPETSSSSSGTTMSSGSDTGLVAAVATLGVLLALSIAAILGITYFFFFRRKRGSSEGSYDNIVRADSSDSPSFNEPPMSAYDTNIMLAYNEQLNKYDQQRRQQELEQDDEEAVPRKSVAFNPEVSHFGEESEVDVVRL